MRRVWLFGIFDTLAVAITLTTLYNQHDRQFYPTCLHIAKSNGALAIVSSFGLYLTFLAAWGLQKILFGKLRAIEIEVKENNLMLIVFLMSLNSICMKMDGILSVKYSWL